MWQLTGFRGYGKPKVQPPVKELIKKKKKKRADQTNSTTTPSPGFSAGDYSYHARNDKIPYLHLE